jgi:hypothetical protein
VLYALLYLKGLDLSHKSAFNTLKNLRIKLQGKLENQPLGNIQDIGTGALKKTFVDEIDNIELLLAHSRGSRRKNPRVRSCNASHCGFPPSMYSGYAGTCMFIRSSGNNTCVQSPHTGTPRYSFSICYITLPTHHN